VVQCKCKSHFAAQVFSASTKDYEVNYLKKITKSNSSVLNVDDELYMLPTEDNVCKLHLTVSLGKYKRKKNQMSFQVNFCSFNIR
jgi:hypothetical protein